MNCPRCDGFAVREYNVQQPAGSPFGFHEWRCLNCGMISDDVIHHNQRISPPVKISRPRGPRPDDRRA